MDTATTWLLLGIGVGLMIAFLYGIWWQCVILKSQWNEDKERIYQGLKKRFADRPETLNEIIEALKE